MNLEPDHEENDVVSSNSTPTGINLNVPAPEVEDQNIAGSCKKKENNNVYQEESNLRCAPGGGHENCQGNVQLDLAWLAENPAFVAACYCLALLHQLGGLDFLSLLGMVLAMTSMVSMFFL